MERIQFLNIGYGNVVSANRVIAIISPDSAPVKRIIQEAKEKGNLIDATYGRKTRCVIIMDNGHVVPVSYTHLDVYKRQEQEVPCTDFVAV